MKRNKIFTYAFIMAFPVLGAGIMTSCTDEFESLNTSDAQFDPNTLPAYSQWLEPMTYCYPPQQNMFQFWTNLNIDWYSGYFMTPNGAFENCKLKNRRDHSGGMHENYYLHIFNNTRRIIASCEAKGENILGSVMRIVQAYGTLMTTDAYGPLAYTSVIEADETTTGYYFDSQQTLFKLMLTDLGNAVNVLSAADEAKDGVELATLKASDVWCGGDTKLWVQVANTMRLRMALRLSKRVDEMKAVGIDLKAIAKEAAQNTLAASGGKDVLINKGLENDMWLMFNWGDCGFNANLVTLLNGMKDPRQPLYMTKNTDEILKEGYSKATENNVTTYYKGSGDGKQEVPKSEAVIADKNSGYYGIRFAFDIPNKPNSWSNMSGWIQGNNGSSFSMPLPIFKGAESSFLLAEARLRGWITTGTVQGYYEEGIRRSIENEISYRLSYATNMTEAEVAKLKDPATITNYLQSTSGQENFVDPVKSELNTPALNTLGTKWINGSQEEQLEQIMVQKYIALFPLSTEAWAEQRRTGYPRLFEAVVSVDASYVNAKEGIRRVVYAQNEYDTNGADLKETGLKLLEQENSSKTVKGDNGGTRLWWDNADKGNF